MKFTILLIFTILLTGHSPVVFSAPHYENMGSTEGLSNNTVTAIVSDKYGYLWVGTLNGLNRYDGTSFKVYERIIGQNNSLSGNEIKSLLIDSLGNLWVGTAMGLSLYDYKTESFVRFLHNIHDSASLSNNNISKIRGGGSHIWVATSNGLNKIDIHTKINTRLYPTRHGGASDEIQDIAEDGSAGLWIGCFGKGVDYFDFAADAITHFNSQAQGRYYMPNDDVSAMLSIGPGTVLVGFHSGELFRLTVRQTQTSAVERVDYGRHHSKIISLTHAGGRIQVCTDQYGIAFLSSSGITPLESQIDNTALVNNKIWYAHESADGILWIGHYRGGITKIDKHYSSRIASYDISGDNPYAKIISAIQCDTLGRVWVGTDGGGAFVFSDGFGEQSKQSIPFLKDKAVLNIAQGAGYVWFGTYEHGLIRCDQDGRHPVQYLPDRLCPQNGPSGKDIRDIYVQDSIVWFCDHGNYLNKLIVSTGQFSHYVLDFVHPELGAVYPSPWCIEYVDDTHLAIGSNRGLLIFDTKSSLFTNITEQSERSDGLQSPMVRTLYRYADDTLLVGTENGMDMFSLSTMSIRHMPDRLFPNNHICAIVADARRDLWVTTKRGICKIDITLTNSQWFDVSDGLNTNDFVENSICKSVDGQIYCGTSNGLASIHAASIPLNTRLPQLAFDGLFLDYNRVAVSDSSVLHQSLNTINTLYIPHWYRTIGVSFSSLSFIQNHKNRYSYKLEGFDQDWNPYSTATSITYNNLRPGTYVLHVKTRNNDGYESEPRQLSIIIAPPYYMTWWFYAVAAILTLIALLLAYRYRTSQIRTKNEFLKQHNYLLSKEIVERKHVEKKLIEAKEIAESANRAKTEFLANMSHEIRTPLNAVHGFCEVISQTELTAVQHKYISSISTASNNLLTLINDLLDLSKIEAGQLEIRNSPLHIACLTGDLEQMFDYMVKKKGLRLEVVIEASVPSSVLLDIIRLRQILVNLMGNAIKFTHEGYVRLRVSSTYIDETTSSLRFDVEDTGIGIHKDNTAKIFQAFSQIESSSIRRYEGTGLGLAICKKMAELMGGHIEVRSTLGKGSVFSLMLPNVSVAVTQECVQKSIDLLSAKPERLTAVVISPDAHYVDQLTDVLIDLSVDVTVFASEDLGYLISLPTHHVIILVFNPSANELALDIDRKIVIVSTANNDYTAYKQICISPPFDSQSLYRIVSLIRNDYFDGSNCAIHTLSGADHRFIATWLNEIEEISEVMDFDSISIAAGKLAEAGKALHNELFVHCASQLEEAIETFDLSEIESVIARLKQLNTQVEVDGRNN